MKSKFSKLYFKTPDERLSIVRKFSGLSNAEVSLYRPNGVFEPEFVAKLSENVFASHPLPLSIVPNFIINNNEILIPYATEEMGVVAGASLAAKLCRNTGGFRAQASEQIFTGQIVLTNIKDMTVAVKKINSEKVGLLKKLKNENPVLIKNGGGPLSIETKAFKTRRGKMLSLYLKVNVVNSTGPNTVGTMCDYIFPLVEEITGGTCILSLHTNNSEERIATSSAVWSKKELHESTAFHGEEIISRILDLAAFAEDDINRACTHNKGIMNGVDALAVATGNDWRLEESAAHAYAARTGKYKPLSRYEIDSEGNLVGSIELPIIMGTEGGVLRHPFAFAAQKIMRIHTARELAEIGASVGLAQNFAALRALVTRSIRKGDRKLLRLTQ